MITSRIVKQVEIPHEPGEWMKFRMLPGKKLEEAARINSEKQLTVFKLVGKEGIEAIRSMTPKDASEKLAANPLANYDIDVLLRAGIIDWSYDIKLSPQNIEDELDAKTREWAAKELLAMTLPSEDDIKNC